jgi:hypothetical protein
MAHRKRRRWWTFASFALILVVFLALGGWSASDLGYISVGTVTCTLEDFQDRVPSFAQFVTKYVRVPIAAAGTRRNLVLNVLTCRRASAVCRHARLTACRPRVRRRVRELR